MVKRDSTVLIGNYYEYTNGSAKKFYYAGGVRIAVRPASDNVARWILSDHLGSTAKTVSSGGSTEGEQRYMPFGLDRYTTGSLNTAYRYTGQRIESDADLYYYVSRWYDPVVGRFLQADSIVPEPGNPQSLNRYSYVANNPVKYVDPTGHAWQFLFQGYVYGGLYGYGSQVKDNLDSGMGLGKALTTDINAGQILRNANNGELAWLTAGALLVGGTYAAMTLGPAMAAGGGGAAGTRR
jgi:RHS repeat-associated protein